ncbi:hypothetical protein M514_23292, partial [Trichuris suis]
ETVASDKWFYVYISLDFVLCTDRTRSSRSLQQHAKSQRFSQSREVWTKQTLPRHGRFVNLGDRIFMIQKIERCSAETLKLLLSPTTKARTWRSFLGRHYQVLTTMPVLSVLAHAVHFLRSRLRRCEQIKCIPH